MFWSKSRLMLLPCWTYGFFFGLLNYSGECRKLPPRQNKADK